MIISRKNSRVWQSQQAQIPAKSAMTPNPGARSESNLSL
jgi:hypothetical protein